MKLAEQQMFYISFTRLISRGNMLLSGYTFYQSACQIIQFIRFLHAFHIIFEIYCPVHRKEKLLNTKPFKR